jgi:hypothetical protein
MISLFFYSYVFRIMKAKEDPYYSIDNERHAFRMLNV